MRYVFVLIPLVALFLAACDASEEDAQATPTPSRVVSAPSPTPEPTPEPTPAVLPSPTEVPSPTPQPTATPKPLRVFFGSERESMGTYLMDADGSNVVRVGGMLATQEVGVWSPDGSKVAYVKCPEGPSSYSELHVANVDGSSEINVSNHPSSDVGTCYSDAPSGGFAWSPDGTRLAFYSFRDPRGLYVVNADGSGLAFLVDGFLPGWSPSGESIAFIGQTDEAKWEMDLEVIRPDGSDRRMLARIPCYWSAIGSTCQPTQVGWSPDGSLLVFAVTPSPPSPDQPPDFNSEVYTLRADGTELTRITDSPRGDFAASWVDCSRPTAGCEARVTNVGPEGLNVRLGPVGPGRDAPIIGKLKEGDVICLAGPPWFLDGYKWWPLHAADGIEGWAAAFDPAEYDRPWLTATGETCQ